MFLLKYCYFVTLCQTWKCIFKLFPSLWSCLCYFGDLIYWLWFMLFWRFALFALFFGIALVAQTVKNLPTMQETEVQSRGWEDPLKKVMATHSSILVWKTPWTKEPGRLQSKELQRVRHDWTTNTFQIYVLKGFLGNRGLLYPRPTKFSKWKFYFTRVWEGCKLLQTNRWKSIKLSCFICFLITTNILLAWQYSLRDKGRWKNNNGQGYICT